MAIWLITDWAHHLSPIFRDIAGLHLFLPGTAAPVSALGAAPTLVVNWTRTADPNSAGPQLNRQAALQVLADGATVRERLSLNGMAVAARSGLGAGQRVGPVYRVGVFDLQIYGMQRSPKLPRHPAQGRPLLARHHWERVTAAALRALHCLGLDTGVVHLTTQAADNRWEPAVSGIAVGPLMGRQSLGRLKVMLAARLQQPPGSPARLRLGADPEFMLRHRVSGEMMAASRFFQRYGYVGCDTQSGPRAGEYPVAELRPGPRGSPEALLQEIKRCLHLALARAPYGELEWLAGAQPFAAYATGGHIHFSGVPLTGRLLRALDTYLAVPVLMIEPPTAAAARRRQHGFLGDVRLKRHGGFEYRTLPSWLVDPALARAVLHLAWLVVRGYEQLSLDLFQQTALQRAFYGGDQQVFRSWLPRLWADLARLPDYEASRNALAPLQKWVSTGTLWDDRQDFRRHWRLPTALPMGRQGSEIAGA